jgi:arylsulfatase A-like enzyme
MSRTIRVQAGALALLLVGACSGEEPDAGPRWVRLAQGFRPAPPRGAIAAWELAGATLREDPDGSGVWLDVALPPDAWEEVPGRERFWTPMPESVGYHHDRAADVALRLGDRELEHRPDLVAPKESPEAGGGLFHAAPDALHVLLPGGQRPEEAGVFSKRLPRGTERDGVWRTAVEEVVGEGLTVWPGERVELPVTLVRGDALRLRLLARGFRAGGRVTLHVELDGEPLAEAGLDLEERLGEVPLVVPLPADRAGPARLAFAVDGPPAVCAVLEPVLGPAAIGTFGARPWETRRPDLVLFVADTFRADNLAAWGGDAEVAPHLNALVERSRRYVQARSTGVWTLPTHASLFTGLFPTQHGATEKHQTFPESLVTIAEHLQAAGYRTGAVTEPAFVSRTFGLDQGFGWFEELGRDGRPLARTLRRAQAFLDHDDGRPLLLFVHTYRTHAPYRLAGEETAATEKELITRVARAVERHWAEHGRGADPLPVYREHAPEYLALYRGGASALDARFGPWFADLERRGLFADGVFLLTSDHGEEFYEHGNRAHGWAPNEEKIRVPLFLFGAGIEPGAVGHGASLVDVAPTLAELAGAPALSVWPGRSLLALDGERPLFAFNRRKDREYLSFFEGGRKIFARDGAAFARGELESAYDLVADPAEARDLLPGDPAWARELAERLAPLWERLAVPLGEAEDVELDAATVRDLQDLGYVE